MTSRSLVFSGDNVLVLMTVIGTQLVWQLGHKRQLG